MPETLHLRDELKVQLLRGFAKPADVIGRVSKRAAEPFFNRPGEHVFPFDHHHIVTRGGKNFSSWTKRSGVGLSTGYKPILLLSSIPLGTCLLGTVLQLDPVGERQVYRVLGSWLQDAEGQIKREYD